MEMIDHTPVHYEYVVENNDIESTLRTKQIALDAMRTLDGWCTKCKASVMMDLIFMFQPETVVEIGVFGGMSLVPMAFALKHNKSGTVYGIDPWATEASVDGMEGVNQDWWGSIDHDKIMQRLVQRINEYKLNDQIVLIRDTSENCPAILDVDMLHIDGNHSEKASYTDVTTWVPRVKDGGIIVFDDINWETTGKAVQYLNENCTKLAEFYGDNIWGIWIK